MKSCMVSVLGNHGHRFQEVMSCVVSVPGNRGHRFQEVMSCVVSVPGGLYCSHDDVPVSLLVILGSSGNPASPLLVSLHVCDLVYLETNHPDLKKETIVIPHHF